MKSSQEGFLLHRLKKGIGWTSEVSVLNYRSSAYEVALFFGNNCAISLHIHSNHRHSLVLQVFWQRSEVRLNMPPTIRQQAWRRCAKNFDLDISWQCDDSNNHSKILRISGWIKNSREQFSQTIKLCSLPHKNTQVPSMESCCVSELRYFIIG